MVSVRRRLAVLLAGLLIVILSLLLVVDAYDIVRLRDQLQFLKFSNSLKFTTNELMHLEIAHGLTIFGDSYSAGNQAIHWHNHISIKFIQNLAEAGAVVDVAVASRYEKGSRPSELSEQVKKLTHLSDKVVIWFGVNDAMVFFAFWPNHKSAITKELRNFFSLVDALLQTGVKTVVIPCTIDFTDAPGLVLARPANLTAPREVAYEVIHGWNTQLKDEIRKRSKDEIKGIDFYTMSQQWLADPTSFGMEDVVYHAADKAGRAFFWSDFLHVTPWVQEHLFAPEFRAVLNT